MKRLDLDDLPPKVAQLLAGLETGEELLLVWNGGVTGRVIGGGASVVEADPEPPPSQERAAEIFEQFRAQMEDEF